MTRIEELLAKLEPDWPETPDPWPAVRSRLTAPQTSSPPARRRWLSVAAVVIAALALGGALFGALPVIADGLGIGRVEIELAPIDAVTGPLRLGEPVVGDPGVVVPTELGAPDGVYRSDGITWLVYRPQNDLPEVLDTGVGALLARIEGEALLEKAIDPTVTGRSDISVAGRPGVWLEGGSHELLVSDGSGPVTSSRSRLAGNTLIWVDGEVTYRLEVALPLEDALRIATTMEP